MNDTSARPARPWWQSVLIQAWLPILLIAAWWFGSLNSSNVFWPPLRAIVQALVDSFTTGSMWGDLAYSMGNYFAGLGIAIVLALVIGVVIAEVDVLRRAFMPYLDFARAMPHVSFVPVIILALGIGALPKIFLIAFGCVWPILLNTIEGIRTIPPTIPETARSYRVPVMRRVFRVLLPGALPQIAVGIRVAISVGVVMLLVSEMFGADQGVGFFIVESKANFALADTWAGTIVIGILGYLLSMLFRLVEWRLLGWYHRVVPKEANPATGGTATGVFAVIDASALERAATRAPNPAQDGAAEARSGSETLATEGPRA